MGYVYLIMFDSLNLDREVVWFKITVSAALLCKDKGSTDSIKHLIEFCHIRTVCKSCNDRNMQYVLTQTYDKLNYLRCH